MIDFLQLVDAAIVQLLDHGSQLFLAVQTEREMIDPDGKSCAKRNSGFVVFVFADILDLKERQVLSTAHIEEEMAKVAVALAMVLGMNQRHAELFAVEGVGGLGVPSRIGDMVQTL